MPSLSIPLFWLADTENVFPLSPARAIAAPPCITIETTCNAFAHDSPILLVNAVPNSSDAKGEFVPPRLLSLFSAPH
jgi:hypothetical protein